MPPSTQKRECEGVYELEYYFLQRSIVLDTQSGLWSAITCGEPKVVELCL